MSSRARTLRSLRRRRPGRAGFTLIELMIAMTAGLLTLAGAYYLGNTAQRAFSIQLRNTAVQAGLRSAMEQLQRDVTRAGFMATADSDRLPDCSGNRGAGNGEVSASGRVVGIGVRINGSTRSSDSPALAALLNIGTGTGQNNTRLDALTLLGNYATGEMYKVANEPVGNFQEVYLESTRESFRRTFWKPAYGSEAATLHEEARFKEVFAPGRLVRIDSNNHVFFREVDSSDMAGTATNPRPHVVFKDPLPQACFGYASAFIAPVDMIRYRVEEASGVGLSRVVDTTGRPGRDQRAALVRSEISPYGPVTDPALPDTRRMVLDYAVEFLVDAVVDTSATAVPALQLVTGTDVETVYQPSQFRALRITLSARNEEPEKDFAGLPMRAALTEPLRSFRVDAGNGTIWNARVRTLREEIVLRNLVN